MAKKQEEKPLHELLPPCTLTAAGASSEINQGNLIAAKQSFAFPIAGGLIAHCLVKRGDRIMLDYTQQGVAVRFQIDGVWHNVEPRDRESGDAVLAVLKKISNLNATDRRSRQEGTFGAEFKGKKYVATLTSQGVQTGERVLIKLVDRKFKLERLEEMGMREKMREQFRELINANDGLVLISAPAENGFTTLWRGALSAADRFVRDFVALEDQHAPEEEIINIGPVTFDSKAGETPASILPKLLLKQPDVFVVPEMKSGESLTILLDQINKNQKLVITRAQAKDCSEAVLKLLAYQANPAEVAKALRVVLNMRLARKLCENCKQAFPPPPQLLQQLGIPAGRVHQLYREWQPPPPEQRVDAKGRPIEIPICDKCGGVGYLGRTGIFEMMVVDDKIREVMVKQPTVDALRKASRAAGNRSLQEEAILLVAQGTLSITELQRVMKL